MKKDLKLVFRELEKEYGESYVFEKAQDYVNNKWNKEIKKDAMYEVACNCKDRTKCLVCKAVYPSHIFSVSSSEQRHICEEYGFIEEGAISFYPYPHNCFDHLDGVGRCIICNDNIIVG